MADEFGGGLAAGVQHEARRLLHGIIDAHRGHHSCSRDLFCGVRPCARIVELLAVLCGPCSFESSNSVCDFDH